MNEITSKLAQTLAQGECSVPPARFPIHLSHSHVEPREYELLPPFSTHCFSGSQWRGRPPSWKRTLWGERVLPPQKHIIPFFTAHIRENPKDMKPSNLVDSRRKCVIQTVWLAGRQQVSLLVCFPVPQDSLSHHTLKCVFKQFPSVKPSQQPPDQHPHRDVILRGVSGLTLLPAHRAKGAAKPTWSACSPECACPSQRVPTHSLLCRHWVMSSVTVKGHGRAAAAQLLVWK